jgi:hypothetical protein
MATRAHRSTDLGRHSLTFPEPSDSSGVTRALVRHQSAEPITVAGPCRIFTSFRDASPA